MMQRHYIRCSSSHRSKRVQQKISQAILNTEKSKNLTQEITSQEKDWEKIDLETEDQMVFLMNFLVIF